MGVWEINRENFLMNRHTCGAVLAATLGVTLALASPTLLAAKPGGGGGGSDPCIGATPSFVFTKSATAGGRKDFYLANSSAACQRFLFSLSTGSYERYSSFRVVSAEEGRIVTTDGGSDLLLVRFPISADMQVNTASVVIRRIFNPAQDGDIDATNFDLAADGHKLTYITLNEDGGPSWLFRLRVIDDVDACVPACAYNAGSQLLDDRVGLSYRIESPRWSADGSMIYVEDYYGDGFNPYISRVSASQPYNSTPEVVVDGSKLRLFELRQRGDGDVLAYGEQAGSGCRDVRVVDTTSCQNGSCLRVNNESPRVLVIRFASLQSVSETSITILADDATEGKRSGCSGTGKITHAIDSEAGVQISTVTTGGNPASR
jgi:hypothetical protein